MTGHVFIVRGDLTKLACDAWLLPGGMPGRPGRTWRGKVGDDPAEPVPTAFGTPGNRIVEWTPLAPGDPTPFMTDVGGSHGTPIRWYLDAVEEFFARVSRELDGIEVRGGRARPLVAVPLVGTGQGGKRRQSGAVAQDLLPCLYEQAERTGLDVALVMYEGAAYTAAQAERARTESDAFSALAPDLAEAGRRLAKRAARGELVLFLGAGVSMSAGLPSWGGLIAEIARERCGIGESERGALAELSYLDQAMVLEARLDGDDLGQIVADALRDKSRHYGLTHALLAGLPVDEVITTNYDELFEMATAAASRSVAVLPYQRVAREGGRWLLKMHGCVNHPEDIVLTRDHYIEYKNRREALAGIVQALLITRHMLFVGFSLNDDNFHQIIRAVKRALVRDPKDERPFGTSLVVAGNPVAEEMWQRDLRLLSMDAGGTSIPEASRRLDMMLDRIGAGAASVSSHLFDPRYDDVLADPERRLRKLLEQLGDRADDDIRGTAAWAEIEAALVRLGWRG